MKKVEITIKPDGKTHVGWFVHLFSWDGARRNLIARRLVLTKGEEGDAEYVLESAAELPVDTYGLRLHLLEAGNKASATVTGEPPISYPVDAEWPMSVEVPAEFTQESDTWFFKHGEADHA